jgi:hypothetical protein
MSTLAGMAHDFSNVANLAQAGANHAHSARSTVGSHSDPDLVKAIGELAEGIAVLADAITSLAEQAGRALP